MNTAPLFSICIPTFNAEAYITDCLGSVYSQTCKNWELIICDDCSTDDTVDVVRRFASGFCGISNRLIITKMESNSGPFLARRRAFEHASGDYVICLDADDALLGTTALEDIQKAIATEQCDVLLFNMSEHKGALCSMIDYGESGLEDGTVAKGAVVAAFATNYSVNNLASKAIKRECLSNGSYPFAKGLRMCEDRLEMVGVLKAAQTFALLDKPLYYYRPNLASTTKGIFDFDYCRQQDCVENEVANYFSTFDYNNYLLMLLRRHCLVLISHDMQLLTNGKSFQCLIAEFEALSQLPWFSACLAEAPLNGLSFGVRLRLTLLRKKRYFLASLICMVRSALN